MLKKRNLKWTDFLLSNFEFIAPSLSTTGNFSTDPREMLNGFTGKLILEINDFKRRGEKLVDTVNILNTIFEIDDYNLNNLTNAQKKDLYVNVSRELAENIEKTVNNPVITDTQKLNLKNAIKGEIERLRLLSLDVENVILKKNKELKKVLENSKAFSEIELNFLRKSNYYKQLELSIDKNYIEAGILETSEPVIYARATQSMIPTEPNIKSIFMSNVIIATVIGLLLILVKYIFVPKIYHVRQLDSLNVNGAHILLSNRKELKAEKLSSGENNYLNLNFDFLNKIKEKGSIGCIIDIENKNDSMTFYSDKISLYLANFFTNSNQKSLCCVKEPGFSRISLPSNIARFYNLSNDKEIEANNKRIALASFQSNTAKSDLDSLANIFKRFDNVFISAGEDCSIAFKFDLIDRCDFFILVGKIGRAKLDKFENFLGQSKIISEKYVGCIMVKK